MRSTGYRMGALWGWMTGGPVGALIGGFWGEQWQRWLESAPSLFQWRLSSSPLDTDALFAALGALTEGELPPDVAEGLIRHIGHHLHLDEARLQSGLSHYLAGTASAGQFDHWVSQLRGGALPDTDQISLVASALLQAACLCDPPSPTILARLERARRILGIPSPIFRQWHDQVRAHLGRAVQREDLDEAWQILGIAPGSDFEQVRLAYRRQMSRYHPDKWARGSEQEQIEAHDKAQAIQQAYSRLRRHLRQP